MMMMMGGSFPFSTMQRTILTTYERALTRVGNGAQLVPSLIFSTVRPLNRNDFRREGRANVPVFTYAGEDTPTFNKGIRFCPAKHFHLTKGDELLHTPHSTFPNTGEFIYS